MPNPDQNKVPFDGLPVGEPFSAPLYIMAKPVGAACNLACDYCYYLDKKHLYPDAGKMFMSDATLERYIKAYRGADDPACGVCVARRGSYHA